MRSNQGLRTIKPGIRECLSCEKLFKHSKPSHYMKRGFITLFLLILLVSPIILAAENETQVPKGNETSDVFQGKAGIPAFFFLFWETKAFYLDLSWAEFAVYLMAAALLFVGALEILSFTALESGWTKLLIAGSLLVMMAITGAISKLANIFFNALDNFKIIAWGTVILIIFLLLVHPIFNAMKKKKKLSKAEEFGVAVGTAFKGLKKTNEAAEKE